MTDLRGRMFQNAKYTYFQEYTAHSGSSTTLVKSFQAPLKNKYDKSQGGCLEGIDLQTGNSFVMLCHFIISVSP